MPPIIGHNLQHRGEWSGATQYYEDNIVSLDGSSYICILTNLNQTPPNATYWELIAEKGDTGASGTSPNAFTTIAVSGQSDVVADSTSDTLTLVAGTNVTITTNAGSDTITISATGGGGGIGGSAGSTDNALIRADGTGGATIQSSGATLSDGSVLMLPKGTITASAPHTFSETWNSGGVTFVGMDIAITDTASASASRPFRVTVGGTVIAAVSKTQLISAVGSVVAGNAPGLTFEGFTDTGFGVNGDNLAIWESNRIALNLTTLNAEFRIPSDFKYAWSSATNNNSAADTIIRRASAAIIAFGVDASTPVANKLKGSDGSGTDRPGADFYVAAGAPTGAGVAGKLIFQVATTGATGTTVRSLADRMVLSSVGEALKVMTAAAGVKGLVVKLAATPTENSFEVRDSTETVLSSMDSRGMYIGPATTTAGASARLPHGTAPTSPVNGDLWSTTSGFYGQVNGSTVGPFGAGGAGISDGATLATGLTFPIAGLHILDTDASHDLILSPGSNLSADRTLTITTGDANRTLTMTGDASITGTNSGDVTLSGTPTYITVSGQTITRNAITNADINTSATVLTKTINLTIDGGGSAITTGLKGYVRIPYACTVTGWSILADQTGSIVVDVWKDTYANFPPVVGDSIAGSEKPTLSSAVKNEDTSLTTWTTTSVAAGDVIAFSVDSVSTVTRVHVALNVRLA